MNTKDRIVSAMVNAGVSAEKANRHWKTVCDALNDGDDISEQGFRLLTEGDIMSALPGVAGRAFLLAIQPDTPRPMFKAKKATSYTPEQLVAFLGAEEELSPDDKSAFRAEIQRRTGGRPFRFVVDGKLMPKETADRIQALWDKDPVAPFVVIGDKEVEPIGFDIEPEKMIKADPFDVSSPLGQPGDVSARIGQSLAGIGHETRQAIAVAMRHDLTDAPNAILLAVARDAAEQTAEKLLDRFPRARRAWASMPVHERPSLLIAKKAAEEPRGRPFGDEPVAPVAAGDTVPFVYVVGAVAEFEGARMLRSHLNPAIRSNRCRVVFDSDCPPGACTEEWQMRYLTKADIVVLLMTASVLSQVDAPTIVNTAKRLIPIVVRACDWKSMDGLGGKVALPRNGRPAERDDGQWSLVAQEISAMCAAKVFTVPTIDEIHSALVRAGLVFSRRSLLSGLNPMIVGSLFTASSPSAQVLSDLHELSRIGGDHFRLYLSNAVRLSEPRAEAEVIRRAMRALT